MIDKELDTAADRLLHDKFIDAYRQNMTAVNLWPPMDIYELFYRWGRMCSVTEIIAQLQFEANEHHRRGLYDLEEHWRLTIERICQAHLNYLLPPAPAS